MMAAVCHKRLLLFFFGLIFGLATANLIDSREPVGKIARDAPLGTQVLFDAPPRASKKNSNSITISIEDNAADAAFGLFPTTLGPGDPFALVLKDNTVIPVLDDDNVFNVTITSKDQKSSKEDITILSVKLINPPIEAPVIWQTEQVFRLSQRLTPGIVGKIGVKNFEKTDLSKFGYQLFGGFTDLFEVTPTPDGLFLRTTGCSLDVCLQLPPSFTLLLHVDPLEPNRRSKPEMALLHLNISRDNLFGPKFTAPVIYASIDEHASAFADAVQVDAIDPDDTPDSGMSYLLVDHADVFAIDPATGLVTVKNASLVTVENLGSNVQLTVHVSDNKTVPDECIVDITVFEKPDEHTAESDESLVFEFEQSIYAFAVAPRQRSVGQVALTTDSAPWQTVKIAQGSGKVFAIDDEGVVTYHGPVERVSRNYTLQIAAIAEKRRDLVAVTSAQILVAGIGSNPPKFGVPYASLFVSEETPAESVVHTLLANDADVDAALVFALESSTCINSIGVNVPCSGNFIVRPSGEVVLHQSLAPSENSESQDILSAEDFQLANVVLNVSVLDKTHKLENKDFSTVLVTVTRKNDTGIAVFEFLPLPSEGIVVADDLPVGSYVYTVQLRPVPAHGQGEGSVKYELSEDSAHFRIDPVTGMIFTKSSLKSLPTQTISVMARPNDNPQLGTNLKVRPISMDTPPPIIRNLEDLANLQIPENAPEGSEIVKIDADSEEGGQLTYELLLAPEQAGLLQIDDNGTVFTTAKILDFEKTNRVLGFVLVVDQMEKTVTAPLDVSVINENDNVPVFGDVREKLEIYDDAPEGSVIGGFWASDADGDELEYSIQAMEPLSVHLVPHLSVDNRGQISVGKSLAGLTGEYQIAVTVSDGVHRQSVPVSVTVISSLRCQPVFFASDAIFDVSPNAVSGQIVGRLPAAVTAPENCELISYGIKILDSPAPIVISPTTGEVSTSGSLEAFAGDRIAVNVTATSSHLSSSIPAEIRVAKKNSTSGSEPDFGIHAVRLEVAESAPPGAVLGQFRVKPLPGQTGVIYRLENTQNDTFAVDPESAVLTLLKPLDHEAVQNYRLKLVADAGAGGRQASDELSTGRLAVNVVVLDVNDNGPKFVSLQSDLVIDVDAALPGDSITDLNVMDADQSEEFQKSSVALLSTVYKHNRKSMAIEDVFQLRDDDFARAKLVVGSKALRDYVGGFFEVTVTATDASEHAVVDAVDQAVIRIWVVDRQMHTIPLVVNRNPIHLSSDQLRGYMQKISKSINKPVILQDVRYHLLPVDKQAPTKAITASRDSSVASLVALDRHAPAVVLAKNVRDAVRDLDIEGVSLYRPVENSNSDSNSVAPAGVEDESETQEITISSLSDLANDRYLLLGVVSVILLTMILGIIAVVCCYKRRNNYRVSDRADSVYSVPGKGSPGRPPLPPPPPLPALTGPWSMAPSPYFTRPSTSSASHPDSSTVARESSASDSYDDSMYIVQERKLSVST